jgi:hypothetical protein
MSGRSTLKSKSALRNSKVKGPKWSKTRSKNGEGDAEAERRVLTKFAKILFSEDAINAVKTKGLGVRDIWEISTPTSQCNNTIGKVVPHTTCWICDERITESEGMKAECEHILPIAQAAIYLRLYAPGVESARDKDAQALEYGWAHTVCNREKSDICALVKSEARNAGVFKIDIRQIQHLLKSIFYSARSDSGPLKGLLLRKYGSVDRFAEVRLPEIVARYQRIVDFLTRGGRAGHAAATIITLAGVSGLSDLKIIRKELHELLNPDKIKEAIEAEQAELGRAAAIFSRGEVLENITQIMTFYNDVQESVVRKLDDIVKHIPMQPAYREYFSLRGINPRAAVNSLNPDGFQSDIFRFLVEIYPTVYKALKDHAAVRDAVSDFICLKLLPTFLPVGNNSSRRPDRFFREVRESMARLECRLNAKIESVSIPYYLNAEYDKFVQVSAAETMLTLGRNTRRLNALIEAAETSNVLCQS